MTKEPCFHDKKALLLRANLRSAELSFAPQENTFYSKRTRSIVRANLRSAELSFAPLAPPVLVPTAPLWRRAVPGRVGAPGRSS